MNRVLDLTKKMVWGLAGLSIVSCLARNDYNVIFSFFYLLILNKFYNDNPKLFTKIIVQSMTVLIIADLIWIIVMFQTWDHTDTKNVFWNSLSGLHTFVKFLAFLELILKGLIVAYLVYDYKQKNPAEIRELMSISYLETISPQNKPTTNKANPDGTQNIGAQSDFVNPYA